MWTRAAALSPPSDLDTRVELATAGDLLVRASDDLPFALSTDSAVITEVAGPVFVRVLAQGAGGGADPRYALCAALAVTTESPSNQTVEPYSAPQLGELAGRPRRSCRWSGIRRTAPTFTSTGSSPRPGTPTSGRSPTATPSTRGGCPSSTRTAWWSAARAVSAALYDPAPAAAGYPVDAALMYTSIDGRDVHVEVSTDSQVLAGRYVLLRHDLGPAFALEEEPTTCSPRRCPCSSRRPRARRGRSGCRVAATAPRTPST